MAILGGKPEYNNFLVIIGISIVLYSVYTSLKCGNGRLQYLSKSKWWSIFSLFALTEPFFHIAMCAIKDKQKENSLLEDKIL